MATTNDNPHHFTDSVLSDMYDTSSKMYDEYYDLLAKYQFGFTLEQKLWMLDQITADIRKITKAAEEGNIE